MTATAERVEVRASGVVARRLSWWRELAFVAVVYASYEVTRGLHHGGLTGALANGRSVRFLAPRLVTCVVTGHL
ncbi:MAG TPA: hypothetical protein VKQ07_04165 [Jatrophihabitantaceae bacterium]|nr:hypothetical protein [Jatrophihabitantaceae bacterium]